MTDHHDEVRRLIDLGPPVTLGEARTAGAVGDLDVGKGPDRGLRQRRALIAAVLVLFVAAAAIAVWARGGDHSQRDQPPAGEGGTGEGIVVSPGPTVLPPVGDDPLVACDPQGGRWFRRSVLDDPTGVENEGTPATEALRNHLRGVQNLAELGVPPSGFTPTSGWHRIAETETAASFVAGQLPLLSFLDFEVVDGVWNFTGSSSGTCNEVWVYPGAGLFPVLWGLAPGEELSPDATSVRLQITPLVFVTCPQGPLTAEELVGPDVIETEDAVTIRVATTRPTFTYDDQMIVSDDGQSGRMRPDCTEPPEPVEPLDVVVELRQPLGDRPLLDATFLPARQVEPPVPAPERPAPQIPVLEFPGGTVEVDLFVQTSPQEVCDAADPAACGSGHGPLDLTLTITAGGRTEAFEAEGGVATLVLPAGPVTVAVDSENLSCPPLTRTVDDSLPQFIINCVRLDLPHATVSGHATSDAGGVPTELAFEPGGIVTQSVYVPVDSEGHFEVILPTGEWYVSGASPFGGFTACNTGPMIAPFTVEDGAHLELDLGCPG